ncbi:MAG: hypothetical protein ABII85_01865 [Bacillota bacterium]
MYVELYDRNLNHITNIEISDRQTSERVFDPGDGTIEGKTNQKINDAILYVLKDKPRESGYRYHAGFAKNIKYISSESVRFKCDDLRKIYDIDILIDWSNEVADMTVYGIFRKVADTIVNSKDSMINNIPIYFEIPADSQDTKFIADYSHRYLVVNATKFLKVYLGYFGYYIESTYNQSMNRVDFIFKKQGSTIDINIKDFIHEKTTSDIKTNKTIATISYSTVEEVQTEWIASDITEYDAASNKSTIVGEGTFPDLPNPDVYENNYIIRRAENKQYTPGNATGYNASEFKATRYVLTTPRTSCPFIGPNGTQVWDLISAEAFDDTLYYRVAYKYINSSTGIMTYCSTWTYGKLDTLGAIDYYKKIGSTYYPRPDLPERVYTLGSDNQIYEGYAPSDKRIYPVQQKIFESGVLAEAQLNAVYELVNTRYVENIILTDDNVMSPIVLEDLQLNSLIKVYDENGDYKVLPVAEKSITQDINGFNVEVKLGFKKTKLTEIIKFDITDDKVIPNNSKAGSTIINEGAKVWTQITEPDSNYKTWIRPKS